MVPTYTTPGEPSTDYHEYDDDYLQTLDPRKDHGPAEYYTKPYIDKKEQELKGLVKDEETTRISEDEAIRASLSAEEVTRVNENTAIRKDIADEAAARTAGDKAINDKIPSTASKTNKLVDTAQMNEAINSMAAFYITKNTAGDAFGTVAELTSATEYYCDGSVRVPTRNDYATVLSDEDHENAATRYIYTGTRFQYQYTVNEAPFTQEQLNAINSGVTSDNYVHKENPVATGSLSINRTSGSTVGDKSVAVGNNTTASGASSFAEGDTTTAEGVASHAEGYITIASGTNSHAEGFLAKASNSYAHAEGHDTEASGESAHSEGTGSIASGSRAHAEGGDTKAIGYYAHAEGYGTESGKSDSIAPHAEGDGTHAINDYAHAEGYSTTASGTASHAEGYDTYASGKGAHAEGKDTVASGMYSHAEGYKTRADSDYMHAAGINNKTISGLARVTGWGDDRNAKDIEKLDILGNLILAGNVYSENDKLLIAAANQSLTAAQKAAARENIGIDNTLFTAAVSAAEQAQASAAEASQYAADARPAIEAADRADTSATNAASSASAAKTSETNAANSKTAASTSATNAANSKTAAANSASAASKSATAADTSAKAAKTSETNAANSKTAAATSATNAANSASAAATSATNAASAAVNAIKTLSGSQTSTSSTSQGSNVFTFTFPDGTKKTFTVKNGKDGSIVTINGKSAATVTLYGSDIAMSSSDTTKLNTAIGNKMNTTNPVGTGSFSMNRNTHNHVGTNSVAVGSNCTASGNYSHAEGSDTTAGGAGSHTEGSGTAASGNYSHAEGHGTTASGHYSHAEGNGTIAGSEAMHAAGMYNKTTSGMARVTGWGTGSTAKKDIESLDTSGNLKIAGNIFVNCNDDSSGGIPLFLPDVIKVEYSRAHGYPPTDDATYHILYDKLPEYLKSVIDNGDTIIMLTNSLASESGPPNYDVIITCVEISNSYLKVNYIKSTHISDGGLISTYTTYKKGDTSTISLDLYSFTLYVFTNTAVRVTG